MSAEVGLGCGEIDDHGRGGVGKLVDSSFFCSSSAVNPTLTIIANALRVAEQIDMRISEWSV